MSFSDIFKKNFLENFTGTVSIQMVIVTLVFALIFSLVVFYVYKFTSKNTIYSRNFNITMSLISIITAGVVLSMQANIVVSLGMVGALSIVRFRTAVKEPRDLFFLFWSISNGIIIGAGVYSLVFMMAIVLTIGLLVFDLLPVNRIPYLFESFRSQTKGVAQAYLSIDGSAPNSYSSEWTICTPDNVIKVSENYDVDLYESNLWFENLYNMYIDTENLPVLIKNGSRNIQITNSTVKCDKFLVEADQIIFDVYDGSDCEIVSKHDAHIETKNGSNPEVIINGNGLHIDFPNINRFYKLIKYKWSDDENNNFNIEQFVYIIRKIFVQFRKHRKDTPARDAEKIDFIIVGSEKNRINIFNYLKNCGIIYQDMHLYKINMEKLEENGISWGAVTRNDKKQLECAYKNFIRYMECC